MTLREYWLEVPRSLWTALEFTAARFFGKRKGPGYYVLGRGHYHIEKPK